MASKNTKNHSKPCNQPETKNLLKLRFVFLRVFNVKKHLIETCNIPISRTNTSIIKKGKHGDFFFFLSCRFHIRFAEISTKILEKSPLYQEVPSYHPLFNYPIHIYMKSAIVHSYHPLYTFIIHCSTILYTFIIHCSTYLNHLKSPTSNHSRVQAQHFKYPSFKIGHKINSIDK
jgi:hypothetical protein